MGGDLAPGWECAQLTALLALSPCQRDSSSGPGAPACGGFGDGKSQQAVRLRDRRAAAARGLVSDGAAPGVQLASLRQVPGVGADCGTGNACQCHL